MPTISLSVSLRSHLRSSTAFVDPYEVNSFSPDFVLDFKNSVYKTGGADTTLSSAVTHARAGNATMVDSDGLLKWAPHNLLIRSEELNLWSQSGTGSVVVDNAVAPDGTTTAATFTMGSTTAITYIRSFGTYTAGDIITYSFWARSDNITSIGFGINGGASTGNNSIFTNLAVTSTWSLLEFEFTVLETDTNSFYYIIGKQGDNSVAGQLGDVEIWHPHSYRSDLGGMVNNSATGNSYVPTTSSSVYLPRVGHHIYNGSAWVNEGVLHESEARTNLVTYSNDFTHSSWTKYSVGITENVSGVTAPDGTQTVDKITPIATNEQHRVWYGVASTAVGETYSVYAKSAGYDYIWVGYYEAPVYEYAIVNLTNGAVTSSNADNYSVEDVGNGFYRISVIKTIFGAGSSRYISISPSPTASPTIDSNGAPVYVGDGTSGVYVYGAQIEAGSTPSSYIPTSGSAVTRAAETLTVPAANMPWPTPVETTGTELVTNGTFDANDFTGWEVSNDPDADASSGAANIGKLSGDAAEIRQTLTVVSGRVYKVEFDITSVTGSSLVQLRDGTGQLWQETITAPTSVVVYYTETTTQLGLNIRSRTDGVRITIDNISVKEINPLALSIQMDGKMTYADTNVTYSTGHSTAGEATWFRWSAANTEFLYAGQATVGGRTGQMIVGQRTLGTSFSFTVSTFDYFQPDINVPFNIATRHGSTFLNISEDGTALTAVNPTALPALSTSNLDLGWEFMGTIGKFRMWDEDLTDAGIEEAST
jgi:hypothetical protein